MRFLRRLFRKRKYKKEYDIGDTVSCFTLKEPYSPSRGQVKSILVIAGHKVSYTVNFSMMGTFHYNNLVSSRQLLLERQ